MKKKIPKKFLLGFMQIHILIQAKRQPFFGLGMIEDLKTFGYNISPGTLYPILAKLEKEGLLIKSMELVNGKNRNYYNITEEGIQVLIAAKESSQALLKELEEI